MRRDISFESSFSLSSVNYYAVIIMVLVIILSLFIIKETFRDSFSTTSLFHISLCTIFANR